MEVSRRSANPMVGGVDTGKISSLHFIREKHIYQNLFFHNLINYLLNSQPGQNNYPVIIIVPQLYNPIWLFFVL